MTSPLRTLAYRHRWLYDSVTAISAVAVGGVERLRDLGADWLAEAIGAGAIGAGASVLDLCCGGGDAAIALAGRGFAVTGLDVAPRALEQAARRAPQLSWIEGLAEDPPFSAGTFDAVQISLALHEFTPEERRAVLVACHRVLKPNGVLVVVDLHAAKGVMALPQAVFCHLFETETAEMFLADNLGDQLEEAGFELVRSEVLAMGALQRLLARRQSGAHL